MSTRLGAIAIILSVGACAPAETGTPTSAAPPNFVGVRDDGSVVLARTADGSTERSILPAPTGKARRKVRLLDDGKTLYVWTAGETACGRLERVSLDGGSPETVLEDVRAWDVSGDGGWLAYTTAPVVPDGGCGEHRTVVLRNLNDESERRWLRTQEPDDLQAGVVELRWVDAPRYVAWVSCGADACGPATLDTTKSGPLDAATLPRHGNSDPDPAIGLSPDWFPAATITRDPKVSVFSVDYSSTTGSERYPIVEADALSGAPKRALFTSPGRPLDFDRTGTFMLFLADEDLQWWSSDGGTKKISKGFVEAAW